MARRAALCSQSDVTKLVKAVLAAGISVERIASVKLTSDGVLLRFGDPKEAQDSELNNEWDTVLQK